MDDLSLRRRAERSPHAEALILSGRSYDWATLANAVARVQLEPYAPLSFCAESSFELIVSILACLEQRRPFALLHPRLADAERREQARFWHTHAHAIPHDTAVVLFTSGTTGRAKAACLSRAAFIASAQATGARLGSTLRRWLLALPLCHVGGLSVLTRALVLGTAVVVPDRTDTDALAACILHTKPTGASLVPTQLRRLVDRGERLDALGTVILGGAAARPLLLDAAESLGARVFCTYGMTETCAQITLEAEDARERSSGVPLGEARVTIRDPSGAPAPTGTIGTVWVDGPSLFLGYLGHPERHGAFETGDLGWQDEEGALHIESRRTDLIVSGGENIYPLELERALLEHPEVLEALVFAADDPEWGQHGRALLVLRDPSTPLTTIATHLDGRLARFKWPRFAAITAQLPLTPLGKPDRRAAAELELPFQPWPRA